MIEALQATLDGEFEVLNQEMPEMQEQPQPKPVSRTEAQAGFNYENFKLLFLDRYKKTTVAVENEGSKINLAIQEVNKYLPPKVDWEYYLVDATNPIFPLAGAVKTLTNLKTDIEILQGKQIEGLKKDCEQMFAFADRVMAERDQLKRIVIARESQFKEQFEKEKSLLLEQLKDYENCKAEAERFKANLINVDSAYAIVHRHQQKAREFEDLLKSKLNQEELEIRAKVTRDRKEFKEPGVGPPPGGKPVVSIFKEKESSDDFPEPEPLRRRGRPPKREVVETQDDGEAGEET